MTNKEDTDMHVSIKDQLRQAIREALGTVQQNGMLLPEVDLNSLDIALTKPKQKAHGDYACNVALALKKQSTKNPRELGVALQEALLVVDGAGNALLDKVSVAGPGFLNMFVKTSAWHGALANILSVGPSFLRSSAGAHEKILIEFVSANPTGPLHVGHGRGAVIGDIVARLLNAAGYDVQREYYVNDLGNQIDVLARSVFLRYGELHGKSFEQPEDFYPGAYVVDIAQALKAKHRDSMVGYTEDQWMPILRGFATAEMLERIKTDLEEFGIRFDNFVSERELTQTVGLEGTIEKLLEAGYIYEEDGKRWFRTTDFGDDKDRVVAREDGRTTYFASDIAYHGNKMERGFSTLINVLGADHGGYVARLKAGLAGLGFSGEALEVIFIQMVSLTRGGETVRMGKRLGTAVWLRDVVNEAGRDATRYFFAMRRPESQMEFDIELATKKSLDNPVYYAQMGHARLCALGRKAVEQGYTNITWEGSSLGDLTLLTLPEEIDLIRTMVGAPEMIALAAKEREPHQVVYFIQELITKFHSYFTQYKGTEKVVSDDAEKTRARLLLCLALQTMMRALLEDILGVGAPQEMYLDPKSGEEGDSAKE